MLGIMLKYKNELSVFPKNSNEGNNYFLLNGSFMSIDSHAYYTIIRHFKPSRIVEIGSGYSTLLASEAILKNKGDDSSLKADLYSIDPYPKKELKRKLSKISNLIVKKVQEIKFSFFEKLKAGDILFIDSSHNLREGGDV